MEVYAIQTVLYLPIYSRQKSMHVLYPTEGRQFLACSAKEKKNYLGENGSLRVYFILYHLDLLCCLEILPFICYCPLISFHSSYMWVMPLSPGYLSWENSQPFSFWSQIINNMVLPFSIPCFSLLWYLFYDSLSPVYLP